MGLNPEQALVEVEEPVRIRRLTSQQQVTGQILSGNGQQKSVTRRLWNINNAKNTNGVPEWRSAALILMLHPKRKRTMPIHSTGTTMDPRHRGWRILGDYPESLWRFWGMEIRLCQTALPSPKVSGRQTD